MGWKVVATQPCQYNQVLRISDQQFVEVFELLHYADGTFPKQFKDVPKRDAQKRIIPDEFEPKPVMCRTLDGKGQEQAHRDFSEDLGNRLIKTGPKKGENIQIGCMKRVPDSTPIGVYPRGTDFSRGDARPILDQNTGQPYMPVPPAGQRGHEDHRRNHAHILEVLPPEPELEDEAA